MNYARTLFVLAAIVVAAASNAGAQYQPYLYPYGGEVQTPGHPVVLSYGTNAEVAQPVTVVAYRLTEQRFIDFVRVPSGPFHEGDVGDLPVAARAESGSASKDRPNVREVAFDELPLGEYVAVARVAGAVTTNVFTVSSLGLLQVRSYRGAGDTLYFPTDLRTYRRYPASVKMQIIDAAGTHPVVERDGIGRYAEKITGNAVVAAKAPDGSLSVVSVEDARGGNAQTGFIQSDRPIYRPGDTVSIRAIVRDGSIGDYTVPSGTLRVRLQAPDGSDVYNHDAAITSFGTVSASVRLPEDAPTGFYQVTVGEYLSSSISVDAYKKPEYQIDFADAPQHVVGGSNATFAIGAKYFFGRPAAGMQVHYTVYAEPHFYEGWWGPYRSLVQSSDLWDRSGRSEVEHGDVTTGEDGRAAFSVPTAATKEDRDYLVAVEARDASGRTVSLSARMLVTAASFQLSLEPATWFGQAGKAVKVLVRSRLYGETAAARPNALVHVVVTGRHWERDKEVTTSEQHVDVTTGTDGNASIDWTPPSGGTFAFVASAADEAGRTTTASTYLWVLDASNEFSVAPLEQPILIPDKQVVGPGDKVKLAIALPKADRDIVLVVSTDRLSSAQIVHVSGTSTSLSVEPPRDAAVFTITAFLPGETGVEQAQTSISVTPPARELHVTIASAKKRYGPGDRATFDVRVVDARGRPQRAELGIGVVDESIYAVRAENAAGPIDALYSGSAYVYGTADWYAPNRGMLKTIAHVTGGRAEDVYSVVNPAPAAAPPEQGAAVRSNFVDTAYWSPSVITDDQGHATVSFMWPDNLTTWRATGIGVTRGGDIGKGSGTALVTKDFLVRLETPRFLRAGDRSQIVGIAHGMAPAPNVQMKLDAGALAKDPLMAALHLDRFQTATASWPVTAPGTGLVMLTLSATDGVRKDAMRLPLMLEAGTAAEHVRDAGSLGTRASLAVTVPPGYLGGALHLTLSPSLIAELVQNQRLLDVYPYYCTEQTMSAGLPAVFIGRVLREAHLSSPKDVDAAKIVRHAVARLNELQHPDGSWGWWENDAAHPFMTAYALYGLAEFRKDGYDVPARILENGVDSLVRQLGTENGETLKFWGGAQPGSEWNTRAFMFYALADAAPSRVDRTMLAETKAHVGELNSYAIAVLGLAEHWLGDDVSARSLLDELHKRAIHDGAVTYWRGSTWHYAWEDDPIETTAYALRFEVAMGEDAAQTDPTVNFLRSQRRGNWWYTTKDTAAAIYALAETIRPDSSEFAPDETVRVVVNGHEVRSLHITQPILDAADASVIVPASSMREGGTVTFERSGRGALYWSSDAVRYVPAGFDRASDASQALLARLFAVAPAISVERHYTRKHGGAWRVGDEVLVEVTVRSRDDVQYVAIEDPYPAGAEHQPEQGRAGDDAWNGIQLLDDRAVFFADRLYTNSATTIRYTLRVTTPGHYTAPATTVYAMYGPPVSALGKPQEIEVVP